MYQLKKGIKKAKPYAAYAIYTGGAMILAYNTGDISVHAQSLGNATAVMQEVPEVITPIGGIALAVFPILIIFALIGFVTGLFDRILGMLKLPTRR